MTRERVLIVGGGIAGASLGSELAADHDVILLEAEASLGVHSTGRSAALFMVGYSPGCRAARERRRRWSSARSPPARGRGPAPRRRRSRNSAPSRPPRPRRR